MRTRAGTVTALVAMLITLLPVAAMGAPGDGGGQGASHRSERASQALAAARQLFAQPFRIQGQSPRARRTTEGGADRHASVVLSDLARRVDDLDTEERAVARKILARPIDGETDYSGYHRRARVEHTCSDNLCFHWVDDADDSDAPDLTDDDGDGVPDWVGSVTAGVFETVWATIVDELGYRAPRSDEGAKNHGPDGRTDIYLADLGEDSLYGYCTWDAPGDVAAYCVVDNDFASTQYGDPPLESLRVTAAHEFFHAVQVGYSQWADTWLMEGTAAWIEDEVFDSINDNLRYLGTGALSQPRVPLDRVTWDDHSTLYSSWIFWRFLSEYFGAGRADDPSVVREIWERVGRGVQSLPAIRGVVSSRGTSFEQVFADFGAVNRVAPRWYSEGGSYARFVARPARLGVTRSRRSTGWRATRLDHLTTQSAVIRPRDGLAGEWRLRILLDLPPRFRGARASVMVHRRDGSVGWRDVALDRRGNGRIVVPFGRRLVSAVALSLSNASTRMTDCTRDPAAASPYSCGGRSRDDGLLFAFNARVLNRR
jgi:hypothetical protein